MNSAAPMDAFSRYRASRPGPAAAAPSLFSKENIALFLLLLGAVAVWFAAAPRLGGKVHKIRASATAKIPDNVLTIVQLDVGQGDATFIHTPSGKNIIIDCGEGTHPENTHSRQYPATAEVVIPFLELHGIYEIDLLILTHPDSDHGGGMAELIEWLYKNGGKVKMFVDPGVGKRAKFYMDILDAIDKYDIDYITVLDPKSGKPREYLRDQAYPGFPGGTLLGQDIANDPTMVLQIMGPVKKRREANNCSVVSRLQYGDFSFLSAGDAEDDQEADIVKQWGDRLRAKLHFLPHHGSKTSDNPYWLMSVNAELISTSSHPPVFGHPAKEVLDNWKAFGDPPPKFYTRTDLNGDIWFRTDGKRLAIRTQFKYEDDEKQWEPAKRKDWKPYRQFKSNDPTTYEDCHPVPGTDDF